MIRHFVMWKLKEENKNANAAKIKRELEALVGQIDGLISASVHSDTGGAENYDLCLDSVFSSPDALERYKTHPLHVAVSDFVKAVRLDRKCIDFEI